MVRPGVVKTWVSLSSYRPYSFKKNDQGHFVGKRISYRAVERLSMNAKAWCHKQNRARFIGRDLFQMAYVSYGVVGALNNAPMKYPDSAEIVPITANSKPLLPGWPTMALAL